MAAIALPGPSAALRLLVQAGLLPALVVGLVATAHLFDASKKCRGAFSSGFSSDFDVHRCKLTVRAVGSDFKVGVPLPY